MISGNISSLPVYPENFILPNGEKALRKELEDLSPRTMRAREIKKLLLSVPVMKTIEQNVFVLPGNGCKIRFTDTNEGIFCVLDGTHKIKEHGLPRNTAVVLASSSFGKSLKGKGKGEKGLLKEGNKERSYVVEDIFLPSKAKWPFKFGDFLVQ